MSTPIGIVNYGCGNIQSMKNALIQIGAQQIKIIESAHDLALVNKIILPGVGAFDSACLALNDQGLFEPLQRFLLDRKNKALGVCLGMHVLCSTSDEGKEIGLSVVNASVKLLDTSGQEKLPHIGWNTVKFNCDDSILEGLGSEQDFYFLHSYRVVLEGNTKQLANSIYGDSFPSIFRSDNIWGVQFHPEKSQDCGLKLISNFVRHA